MENYAAINCDLVGEPFVKPSIFHSARTNLELEGTGSSYQNSDFHQIHLLWLLDSNYEDSGSPKNITLLRHPFAFIPAASKIF